MTQTSAELSPKPSPTGPHITLTRHPATDQGVTLCHGCFDTAVGPVVALGQGGALWGLGFATELPAATVLADLAARWPQASLVDAPEALAPAIAALDQGHGDVTVRLKGTEFQMLVWQALTHVPAGQVISYAMLAQQIGRPKALRAVGTAVGQNPVSWAVPCHRVTRTDGSIGGYHWGEAAKRALLSREGASIAPRAIARPILGPISGPISGRPIAAL